jgi:hypothetical protein
MTRYLSGLCVAGLGLCGGGWLLVAAVAFGGTGGDAGRVNLATGAGLVLVSAVATVAWALAWRRRLRSDGVLADPFPAVSRFEARRNRRDLARDVRRTARLSRRSARRARRNARRSARRADGEVFDGIAGAGLSGAAYHGNGHDGLALNGHALSGAVLNGAGVSGAALNGAALSGAGLQAAGPHGARLNGNGYHGTGHDGASVADVLGELRALLGPLLAAAGPAPAPPPQARAAYPPPSPPSPAGAEGAEWPRRAAGPLAGDDELLRIADSEEAWW